MLALVLTFATVARAQSIVFEDNFESGNLAQWTGQFGGPHHGQIVADPLNAANHVLTFTGVNAAGDIFSGTSIPANTAAKRYVLSFDFLALPVGGVQPSEYGGFAGVATAPGYIYPAYWVGGTYGPALNVPASVATVLATDGRWHHYEIDFTEIISLYSIQTFNVMLEDWYDRGSIPGDVYFDNVRLLVGSPSQSLDSLISAVNDSDLPANRKRPLLATLDAANATLARGDSAALINQLRAFQYKTRAQVERSDSALADSLISLAQQIIDGNHNASGVIGQVLIYGCAGQKTGDICTHPYQTSITVNTARGNFVTRLTTTPEGFFEVFLDPGDYVLVPDGAGGFTLPSVEVYSIHVDQNRLAPVTIEYDSGMR